MPENFITLKCESCGGKLDVYEDMERFACGHCGTEMVVQRRGGTVALKLMQEAIKKVQIGTDRTAAELALVRLNDELKALNAQAVQLKNSGQGCVFLFGGIFALLGVVVFSSGGVGLGLFCLVAGGGVIAWGASLSTEDKLREVEAKIEDVNRRIAEQKAIVDS